MDIGSEVGMNFTSQNWLCKNMAHMFIFINKIKSESNVVGHLISGSWGPHFPKGHLKVLSSYTDRIVGYGNAALVFVLTGPCCDGPVHAYAKLGHCSLTLVVPSFCLIGLD